MALLTETKTLTGSRILAKALKNQGVEVIFFIMGGPLENAQDACFAEGITMIDVRHEQAAAMMAHAYSRIANRPCVCMGASGPGTLNLLTGVANAWVDGAPVVAIGGSSAVDTNGMGDFQEIDQVGIFKPTVRWAERVYDPRRIPDLVNSAFQNAFAGKPGPVYLDLPGTSLYVSVDASTVEWTVPNETRPRPVGDGALIDKALDLLSSSKRPVVVSGSGVLWSDAMAQLRAWVEKTSIPCYTKPHARGAIPEDHPLSFPFSRSTAFREADLIFVIGARLDYVLGYGKAPRFAADAKLIQVDLDPMEIGRSREVDVGIVGDAGSVLGQLLEASDSRIRPDQYADWVAYLATTNSQKAGGREAVMSTDQIPIHPLRLCKEVRDFVQRDAILVVDGHEILNYARQSIPTYVPRHRLNSGPFGTMGVGLPFGIGAKFADPDRQVVVLHGDGSFGLNAMELDTAVRFDLPVLTVISNNGGWTANEGYHSDEEFRVGRDLGFTRYDLLAETLGCHGEHVEDPAEIRPALERATASGKPAVVNVITEPAARASTVKFASYT